MSVELKERKWSYKGEAKTGWAVQYKHPVTGKRAFLSVPETVAKFPSGKREAKAWGEREVEALKAAPAMAAVVTPAKPGTPTTLAEAVPLYVADGKARGESPSTTNSKATAFRHLSKWNGPLKLTDVSSKSYTEFAAYLSEQGVAVSSANLYGQKFSALMHSAAEWGWLAGKASPKFRKVKDRTIDEGDDLDWLTFPESDKLLKAAKPGLWRTLFLTAMDTGMRPGELCALRWANVDLGAGKHGIIHVRETFSGGRVGPPKSGKPRDVPMTSAVHAALVEWRKTNTSAQVFPGHGELQGKLALTKYNEILRKTCEAAGIKVITAHKLRHTFASQMTILGVHPIKLQRLLGHHDLKETLRYAHLAPSDVADAVDVLDARRGAPAKAA